MYSWSWNWVAPVELVAAAAVEPAAVELVAVAAAEPAAAVGETIFFAVMQPVAFEVETYRSVLEHSKQLA